MKSSTSPLPNGSTLKTANGYLQLSPCHPLLRGKKDSLQWGKTAVKLRAMCNWGDKSPSPQKDSLQWGGMAMKLQAMYNWGDKSPSPQSGLGKTTALLFQDDVDYPSWLQRRGDSFLTRKSTVAD